MHNQYRCKFCGSWRNYPDKEYGEWWIICPDCGARFSLEPSAHSETEIVTAYNRTYYNEEELLGEFNAWLDCERFSDEWTDEEQGILDEALMLVAKKQEIMSKHNKE